MLYSKRYEEHRALCDSFFSEFRQNAGGKGRLNLVLLPKVLGKEKILSGNITVGIVIARRACGAVGWRTWADW